jgi:hypothetical protein
MNTNIGVWLAAVMTLAMYSLVFQDNKVFRVMSSLFIGVAAGHSIVMGVSNVRGAAFLPLVREGKAMLLIPIIGGILLCLRFFPKATELSRLSLGFMGGVSAAVAMKGAFEADLRAQVLASMKLTWASFDEVVILVCTVSTLAYFLFLTGKKSGQALALLSTTGRYAMMIAFGSSMGFTVMARISLLIGRLQFLFGTWIPLIR